MKKLVATLCLLAVLVASALGFTACDKNKNKNKLTVSFDAPTLTMDEWETKTLKATASDGSEVVYSVDDDQTLYLNGSEITALKSGTAKVTAKSGDVHAELSVTVNENAAYRPVATISGDDEVYLGSDYNYAVTLKAGGKTVTKSKYTSAFSGDADAVATVTNKGALTPVAQGDVNVSVTVTYLGKTFNASKKVTVLGEMPSMIKAKLYQNGNEIQPDGDGIYKTAKEQKLNWLTVNTDMAEKGYVYLRFKVNFTAFQQDTPATEISTLGGGTYACHFAYRYSGVDFYWDNAYKDGGFGGACDSGVGDANKNIYFNIYKDGELVLDCMNKSGWTSSVNYLTLALNTDYVFEFGIKDMMGDGFTFCGFDDAAISELTWSKNLYSEDLENKPVYKVEHYKQNADGTYGAAAVTDTLKADAGTTVNAVTKDFAAEGYVVDAENANAVMSGEVAADGSLVLKVYYKRVEKGYKVEYYKQNANNEYVKVEADCEEKTGVWGTTVTSDKTYAGYVLNEEAEGSNVSAAIALDGSTVLKLYFARAEQNYTVEYYKQNEEGTDYELAETVTTGKALTLATVTLTGIANKYNGFMLVSGTPSVLSGEVPETGTLVLKAYYNKITGIPYTVEYYGQKADNTGYEIIETVPLSADFGTETVTAEEKTYENYTINKTAEGTLLSSALATDGTTVLKVYYDRNVANYTVEHYQQNASGEYEKVDADTESLSALWGATVNATAKTYENYTLKEAVSGVVAADGSTVLKVYYNRNVINYTVEHYQQNASGTYDIVAADTENLTSIWGATVNATAKEYDKFTVKEAVSGEVAADGSTVLKVYYDRDKANYTVKHYKETPSGYAEPETETLQAGWGLTVTATAKAYENYAVAEDSAVTGVVAEDGSLVLELHYTRTLIIINKVVQTPDSTVEVNVLTEIKAGLTGYTVKVGETPYTAEEDKFVIDAEDLTGEVLGTVTVDQTVYNFKVVLDRKYAGKLYEIGYRVTQYYAGADWDNAANIYKYAVTEKQIGANGTYDVSELITQKGATMSGDTKYHTFVNSHPFALDGQLARSEKYVRFTANFKEFMSYKPSTVQSETLGNKDINFMISVNDYSANFYVSNNKISYATGSMDGAFKGVAYLKIYKPDGAVVFDAGNKAKADGGEFNLNEDYIIEVQPLAGVRYVQQYIILTGFDKTVISDIIHDDKSFGERTPDPRKTYTVNYYMEQADGSFTIDTNATVTGLAYVGTTITAEQKSFIGFVFDETNEGNKLSGAVAEDGLTLSVYYKIDSGRVILNKTFNGLNGTVTINLATEISDEITGEATVTVDGKAVTVTEGVVTLTASNYYNKEAVEGSVSANGKTYDFTIMLTYENVQEVYQDGVLLLPAADGTYRVNTAATAGANGLYWLTFDNATNADVLRIKITFGSDFDIDQNPKLGSIVGGSFKTYNYHFGFTYKGSWFAWDNHYGTSGGFGASMVSGSETGTAWFNIYKASDNTKELSYWNKSGWSSYAHLQSGVEYIFEFGIKEMGTIQLSGPSINNAVISEITWANSTLN